MSRSSRIARLIVVSAVVGALLLLGGVIANGTVAAFSAGKGANSPGNRDAKARIGLFEQGKEIFRFDTFGDEDYWGGKLQLHEAIEGAALGGVGPGVSPKTALTVAGLKVDVDALPANVRAQLRQGEVDLDRPCDHARAPEVERGRRRQGLLRRAAARSARSASPAPSAIRPSTTRSPRESASGWTAGRTRI